MDGLIVADAAQRALGLYFHDPVVVDTCGSVGSVVEDLVKGEAALCAGGKLALPQLLPAVLPHQLFKAEFKLVICRPITTCEGLCAGNADRNGVDRCGGIGIDHHHGGSVVLFDLHSAIPCHTVIHEDGGKACAGIPFFHQNAGTLGKVKDLQAFVVTQGEGKYAINGGHLVHSAAGVFCPELGIFRAIAGEGHTEYKFLIPRDLIVFAQRMDNFLGDGQIAQTANGIDKFHSRKIAIGQGHRTVLIQAVGHGDVLNICFFSDSHPVAGSHTADVQGVAGAQLHRSLAVCKGDLGGSFHPIGGNHHSRIGSIAVSGEHFQLKPEGIGHIAHFLCHMLGQLDAGFRLYDELTVVAKGSAHIELIACIVYIVILGVHKGNHRLTQRLGLILAGIRLGKTALVDGVAIQIGLYSPHGDIPAVVICPLGGSQHFSGDSPVNEPLCQATAALCIHGVAAIHSAGRTGSTGVQCAILVSINGGIFQIVVLIVLSGGVKVSVCIVGAVAGNIVVIPHIGEEVNRAVSAHMVGFRQICFTQLLLQIKEVQLLFQCHLVNKTDGLFCAGGGQTVQLAVFIQLHIVSKGGDQSRRHSKGDELIPVFQILANLHSGVHHVRLGNAIGFIHLAQIAVGANDEGRIGVFIAGSFRQNGGAFIVEA